MRARSSIAATAPSVWPDGEMPLSATELHSTSTALPKHHASVLYNLGAAHLADARDADSTIVRLNRDLGALRIEGSDIAQDVSTFVLRDSLRRDLMKLERSIDSSYAAAVSWNKAALRLAPADDDARRNLVLAQRAFDARRRAREAQDQRNKDKDANKELGVRALAIMQQADSLVEQYRFNKALELMQQGLREDPSLKQKEEYMKKLETVTNAAKASRASGTTSPLLGSSFALLPPRHSQTPRARDPPMPASIAHRANM
ncbi:MAG: hypothetical protein IPF41_15780 [Flavobacteriales bacterium]|nr:hypothetical protein [Flavobacteriales bacterium]